MGRVGILDVRKARAEACAVFDLRQFAQAKPLTDNTVSA